MKNLTKLFVEAVDAQIAADDKPMSRQTFYRLMEMGYSEEEAKNLIAETLVIHTFKVLQEDNVPDVGSPSFHTWCETNMEDYNHDLRLLPDISIDIETAFLILNKTKEGIPFRIIEFLYNHPPDEVITANIIDTLYTDMYDDETDEWISAPLWCAVIAENHLSEELIDPVIHATTIEAGDYGIYLDEQAHYLIGKLAEKFPDTTVEKVLDAIEEQLDDGIAFSYEYLMDALYYADREKHKDRLIALLQNPELELVEELALIIADLQIKEAIPIIREIIQPFKNASRKYFFENETEKKLQQALDKLENKEDSYPTLSVLYFKTRKPWKEHYLEMEDDFNDISEDDYMDDETDMPDDEVYDDEDFDDSEDNTDRFTPIQHYNEPLIKPAKIERNAPCPCGSGKKYKKCCLEKEEEQQQAKIVEINQKAIPPDIQAEVRKNVSKFNNEILRNPRVYYIPHFTGQYLYLSRWTNDREEPVCRLKYNGETDNWEFAIFKWSSERYDNDDLFIVPGNNYIDGTVEGAMKCGMEAYPV